jgi:hypothetical protein
MEAGELDAEPASQEKIARRELREYLSRKTGDASSNLCPVPRNSSQN